MSRNKKFKKKYPARGIYVLPNIFTTMNIFCGFYAVVAAINGNFIAAPIAILVAVVFDILDGKIARATNTTSRFGVEYDSLADLISFGMAPGIMIYLWALKPLGRIAWLAAFLFTVCGALRLARYYQQRLFYGASDPRGSGNDCHDHQGADDDTTKHLYWKIRCNALFCVDIAAGVMASGPLISKSSSMKKMRIGIHNVPQWR
jgi:CDP-diacylglycerol--serine O-phosphatidyltransferase